MKVKCYGHKGVEVETLRQAAEIFATRTAKIYGKKGIFRDMKLRTRPDGLSAEVECYVGFMDGEIFCGYNIGFIVTT